MDSFTNERFWNLSPLYPSPGTQHMDEDYEVASSCIGEFRKRFRGRVGILSAAEMQAALSEYEDIENFISRPLNYAYLLFAADSENIHNKKLSQKAMEFGNQAAQELLFFALELMNIPDDRFRDLIMDERLATYRHYLESVRRFKPHTLAEREEMLLKQKSLTGIEAFSRLFDELSASFRYTFVIEDEEREMTGEELLGLLHHPDGVVREQAFARFLGKYEEQAITFATILNTVVLDHAQDLRIRNYSSPMEPTHLANEVSPDTVVRMMNVSEDNYPLAQKYFQLKARILKIDRLKNTDIYAPILNTRRVFPFAEAWELVVEAYRSFSPEFGEIVEGFARERRIDVLPRPGKSGGAFCAGISPLLPPFVLLNYTGNLRDVSTLAHELGHGIHYVLAQRMSMLNYHPPLPLAETASVFGEMLLTRLLLERETDPEVKIALLCAQIEDIIATTFRQNVLTRFEERVHLERNAGLLSAEDICCLWWEENAKLYGNAVEMIEAYRWGWSYISHFIHNRFYCYAYTFAELLVLSLFQKYLTNGPSFVPVYRSILESGGSLSPADTVRRAGIDLDDQDFWQEGYDCLAALIEELSRLI